MYFLLLIVHSVVWFLRESMFSAWVISDRTIYKTASLIWSPMIELVQTALKKFWKLEVLFYSFNTLKVHDLKNISIRGWFVCPWLFLSIREGSVEDREGLADTEQSAFGVYFFNVCWMTIWVFSYIVHAFVGLFPSNSSIN